MLQILRGADTLPEDRKPLRTTRLEKTAKPSWPARNPNETM